MSYQYLDSVLLQQGHHLRDVRLDVLVDVVDPLGQRHIRRQGLLLSSEPAAVRLLLHPVAAVQQRVGLIKTPPPKDRVGNSLQNRSASLASVTPRAARSRGVAACPG